MPGALLRLHVCAEPQFYLVAMKRGLGKALAVTCAEALDAEVPVACQHPDIRPSGRWRPETAVACVLGILGKDVPEVWKQDPISL